MRDRDVYSWILHTLYYAAHAPDNEELDNKMESNVVLVLTGVSQTSIRFVGGSEDEFSNFGPPGSIHFFKRRFFLFYYRYHDLSALGSSSLGNEPFTPQ